MRGLASPHPSWVPPRPCDHAAEVPAVLPVHVLAVPDSVHDQSAGHSSCVLNWLRGGANCAENRRSFGSAVLVLIFCVLVALGSRSRLCPALCLWPRSSSTTAVLCAFWFCWLRCTSPCVPFDCCRPGNGEVAQLMLQLLYLPQSGNYFHEPLVPCRHLYAVRHCAEEFLGALDDKEFFVVGGSGRRGRRESDSQVTCHPN